MRARTAVFLVLGLTVLAFAAPGGAADALKVDPALPGYAAVSGVSGNLSSVGSDTLNNLMTLWAETFNKYLPEREDPDRGEGLQHGAAGPDRRHRPARAPCPAR